MVILHRDLFDILRGYSGLLAPKHMVFPRNLSFNEIHNFLVDSILLALNLPHLQAYPPSEQYQYSFWKWAIQHLEDISTDEARISSSSLWFCLLISIKDTEIDDRIYAHFMTLFSPPSMYVLIQITANDLTCSSGEYTAHRGLRSNPMSPNIGRPKHPQELHIL